VRDNGGGVVFGAENEPGKVAAARANFAAAGLSDYIDLREGDLVAALQAVEGPIDFVLFDIWGHVVLPALELLLPRLRPGAVICTDNTASSRQGYAEFFEVIEDRAYGFHTLTLPFQGGFEMTVKGG
jgi:predicted O-methyltransferase YrrM